MVMIIQYHPGFYSNTKLRGQIGYFLVQAGFVWIWLQVMGVFVGAGGDEVEGVIFVDMGWSMGMFNEFGFCYHNWFHFVFETLFLPNKFGSPEFVQLDSRIYSGNTLLRAWQKLR